MNVIQKWAFNIAKPMIKKWLKNELDLQKPKVIQYLKDKADIPKLTLQEETDLYVKLYDALEVAADQIIDRV